MSHILEVQAEAIVDIQEAIEWYEGQRTGLGVEFLEELESSYKIYQAIHSITHP